MELLSGVLALDVDSSISLNVLPERAVGVTALFCLHLCSGAFAVDTEVSAREGNFAFLAVCARTQWILPLRQQTLVVKKGLGRCPSEFHADSETKSGHEHCFARLGWTGFGFRAETDNCMLVCVGRPGSSCQYANICMPGCHRCHVRLKAPVQRLEDNIQRHMNSPMMHDPFLCSTLCDFNLSHSKRRRQDQEQGGTWSVAQEFVCHRTLGSVLRNSSWTRVRCYGD